MGKKAINFRLSSEAVAAIEKIKEATGMSGTAVVEAVMREVARRENYTNFLGAGNGIVPSTPSERVEYPASRVVFADRDTTACPACDGHGTNADESGACQMCDGMGEIKGGELEQRVVVPIEIDPNSKEGIWPIGGPVTIAEAMQEYPPASGVELKQVKLQRKPTGAPDSEYVDIDPDRESAGRRAREEKKTQRRVRKATTQETVKKALPSRKTKASIKSQSDVVVKPHSFHSGVQPIAGCRECAKLRKG